MSKKNQNEENEVDQKVAKAMEGRRCPLRPGKQAPLCMLKDCQFWTGYKITTPYGEGMTWNCAIPLMAENTHYIAQNLFLLRERVAALVATTRSAPTPSAATTEMNKEQLYDYLQKYKDDITVNLTPDGVQVVGWVEDKETREEMIRFLKGQGFRFIREPFKMWFKRTRKQ